jgi:ADP-ribose pyrophosphatase YjhB (NUDIX family)
MSDEQYKRLVQTSVTCFLYCGDDYLFLRRSTSKKIDPGRLNGVGGRLEKGENYADAAIREIKEETGYSLSKGDLSLAGVVKLEEGYEEDWVMCFFKARVASKSIPIGSKTQDGELVWLNKGKVLGSGYDLVDDINYCMDEIISAKAIFFITAQLNNNQKVAKISKSLLPKTT